MYVCDTLIAEAQRMGVTIIEKCTVKNVTQRYNSVSSVSTNCGRINCEYFVNCAGFWARSIGEMSEPTVKIPLQPAEHYFLHTKPIKNVDPMMPVIRDMDAQIYIREIDGRILAGGFDRITKPAFQNVTIPCEYLSDDQYDSKFCFMCLLKCFFFFFVISLNIFSRSKQAKARS